MKRMFGSFFVIVVLLSILPLVAVADMPISDKVSLDGSIRYRLEIDGRDFNNDTGLYDYSLLRTQIGFQIQASRDVRVRIKFKESRYLGTTGSNKQSTAYFDLQEGYIYADDVLGSGLNLQLGRFEMMYGRRRIMGNGIWNNFGPRTYDGFRIQYESDDFDFDVFYAKIVDRSQDLPPYTWDSFDRNDRQLAGFAMEALDGRFQPLVIVDWDNRQLSPEDETELIATAATYINFASRGMSLDLDLAYQFGKVQQRDLSSYLVAADVSYLARGKMHPRFSIGIDLASGGSEEDYLNDEDHRFYTPFMSKHRFRGRMDYFNNQDELTQGLLDLHAAIGIAPWKDAKLSLEGHMFNSVEDMITIPTPSNPTGGGDAYTEYGQELDFRLITPLARSLELDAALCYFMPSDEWQPDGDNSLFIYASFVTTF